MGPGLIERYLRTRGSRYFRGRHDGEFFYVANTRPRRLHVHLEISPGQGDVVVIRVTPTTFFPSSERARLARFAEEWNRRDRAVTAVVHDSSDPRRIGVAARRSQSIPDGVCFEGFASFADGTIADAIDFFGQLTPTGELPALAPPLLRDAS